MSTFHQRAFRARAFPESGDLGGLNIAYLARRCGNKGLVEISETPRKRTDRRDKKGRAASGELYPAGRVLDPPLLFK